MEITRRKLLITLGVGLATLITSRILTKQEIKKPSISVSYRIEATPKKPSSSHRNSHNASKV